MSIVVLDLHLSSVGGSIPNDLERLVSIGKSFKCTMAALWSSRGRLMLIMCYRDVVLRIYRLFGYHSN